jgi:glycolate oxidase iron-sulfur subunit
MDVSEILSGLEPCTVRHPVRLRAAYHDACHLQHAQGVSLQPRAVLGTIPGLEVLEIPASAICCGSAGIYNLAQPEPARELGDRKAKDILSVRPDVVITSNPGCLLQIARALERAGSDVPVVHFVELIDASIRGLEPDAFRSR